MYKIITMSSPKINDKQAGKKIEEVEDKYLNIIESTLQTFKEKKEADIHHLNDIEHLLRHYKEEIENINQNNRKIYETILKLIENKKYLQDKVKDDLKRTDKQIQFIQIQREL